MRTLRPAGIAAALALVTAPAMPVRAQFNPFGTRATRQSLTSEDFTMLSNSAARLNAAEPARVGQSETWSNPRSGSSGDVTLTRIFHYRGLTCHALRYKFTIRSQPTARTYNVNWCLTPEGDWKIAS